MKHLSSPAPLTQNQIDPQRGSWPLFPQLSADGLASESLFRGKKVVEIRHNGYVYKLQTTKLGKLILTK